MLTQMRRGAKSWLAKALFLILILSFGVWGIGDYLRELNPEATIATVGSAEITPSEFRQEFQRELDRMRQVAQVTLDPQSARQLGLDRLVLDRLVQAELMRQYVNDQNIIVTMEAAQALIRETPAFQDLSGQFNLLRFQQVLRENGINEREYIQAITQDIAADRVSAALTAGISVPDSLLDRLFARRFEKRVAKTVRIAADSMPTPALPDEAALRAYFQENQNNYMLPEYRKGTVVLLTVDALAKDIVIDESTLQEAYQARKASLSKPEIRKIEQIVAPSEEVAQSIYQRVQAGEDFATVARDVTGAAPTQLGDVQKDVLPLGMDQAMMEGAFALPEGGASAPIKGLLGWHILHVVAVTEGQEISFAEAEPGLRAELAKEGATENLYRLVDQIEDARAGGASIEEAAQGLGLPILKIDTIDIEGKDRSGQPVAALTAFPNVVQSLFAQPEKTEAEPLSLGGDQGFVFYYVDGILAPAPRPFEEIKDKVAADWQLVEQSKAAAEKAKTLLEEIKQGNKNLDDVAKAEGLSVQTSQAITRDSQDLAANISSPITSQLFEAKEKEAILSEISPDSVILVIDQVIPADKAKDAETYQSYKDLLTESKTSEIVTEFMQALQARYPVSINRAELERSFAN